MSVATSSGATRARSCRRTLGPDVGELDPRALDRFNGEVEVLSLLRRMRSEGVAFSQISSGEDLLPILVSAARGGGGAYNQLDQTTAVVEVTPQVREGRQSLRSESSVQPADVSAPVPSRRAAGRTKGESRSTDHFRKARCWTSSKSLPPPPAEAVLDTLPAPSNLKLPKVGLCLSVADPVGTVGRSEPDAVVRWPKRVDVLTGEGGRELVILRSRRG